jgi:hypothetical protein
MKLETGSLSQKQIEEKLKTGVEILADMDKEEKAENDKWESFNVLIKNSAKFAGDINQRLDVFKKGANDEQRLKIGKYEDLVAQTKEAIKTFLRDINATER